VLEMVLRREPPGDIAFWLTVLSEPKKSGETFLAAVIAIWEAVTNG